MGQKDKHPTLEAREDFAKGIKYCPGCKHKKLLNEFGSNKAARQGLASHCLECNRRLSKKYDKPETRQARYAKNKIRMRNNKLLRDFGITLEEYNQMLAEQDCKCAVCGKHEDENKKSLAVDHCHRTGRVRELLCNNCNAAVGFVQENAEVARNIVVYLEKHKEV